MKMKKLFLLVSTLILANCKSQLNTTPPPTPDYLQINGGVLKGPLIIPNDGLMVGDNQMVLTNGNLGIGVAEPQYALTVNGVMQSSEGVMYPDGNLQTKAAFDHAGMVNCVNCVDALNITNDAVDSLKIIDGSIEGVDIGTASITPNKLANSGVTTGTYGSATNIPIITVTPQGLVTSITEISLGVISGAAGGALAGTYPNPTLANNSVSSGQIVNGSITGADIQNETITDANILNGSIIGADIQNSTITSGKLANIGVSAGTYGDATHIPVVSVNAQGLVSTVSQVALSVISGAAGGDLAGTYPNPTIGNGVVTTTHILDGTITTSDIGIGAVHPTHLAVGAAGQVLATVSGAVSWQTPPQQYGIKFEYVNASTIRLQPSGINGRASVILTNGTDLTTVTLSAALTASLTVSGAGGLDTGSEQNNRGYDVYLIAQAGGASPALLFTLSGSVPTLPGTYTLKSEVLWFVSNTLNNNDIVPFIDLGAGQCTYLVSYGIQALQDGANTAITAVNFSNIIPAASASVKLLIDVENLDVLTTTNLRLYQDNLGTHVFATVDKLLNLLNLGSAPRRNFSLEIPIHNGIAQSLYYSFSAAPAGAYGVDISVQSWTLMSRMSR